MSDAKLPDHKSDDKTVTGPAAVVGLERGEAQPDQVAALPEADEPSSYVDTPHPIETRTGMWSDGSGDTSGYGLIRRVVELPSQPLPSDGWYAGVTARLAALVPDALERVVFDRGELTFVVARETLTAVIGQLRDDAQLRFEFLPSVSGVHYPTDSGAELHVVYHLQSMTHNRRLRVETTCPDDDPHVPSVTPLYPAADWHERETWDMFGIVFDGHPHLTRILMPDDWVGHPQRKDYPLGGIPVEYKGATVPPPDQRRSYR
ncbi:NADH-quinone oxidoreductase subunit C [Micropruina sp.]|uniref:NADH-quinone oxidoreductase subunit C n=1 Tax=Micropruina sp. TaxID=2737536 RepID=UPI0039E62FD8